MQKHMKESGKLILVKQMITQQNVCQVAYTLLKKYRLIAVEVSSQQAVVVDRKVMQKTNLLSY